MNLDAGEVFGIFIMSKFGIIFFFEDFFDYNVCRHCSCIFSFLGLHIYGCVLD